MHDLQECQPPPPAEAIAEVRILNVQYIEAARTSDAAWFRRNMAEDVVIILGSGRRMRKPEFIAMLRDQPKSYRSFRVCNATLRVFGSTVQVDADAPWELSNGQQGTSRYIDSYAWMDGRWQVISAQVTWLPDPPAARRTA
jgi:hypothetical protein